MGPGRVSRNRLAESIIGEVMEKVKKRNTTSPSGKKVGRMSKNPAVAENISSNHQSREHCITISTPDASPYSVVAARYLGMYEAAGTYDGVIYYKQLNTVVVVSGSTIYCYRKAGKWWAGHVLGATWLCGLCCDDGGDSPPTSGWRYYNDKHGNQWLDDPQCSVQDGLIAPCEAVTVYVSLDMVDIAGEYLLIPDHFSEGRVILKHRSKDRFLKFYGGWCVTRCQVIDSTLISYSDDGRRTLCPGQDQSTRWRDHQRDRWVTVNVTCHTHK